MRLIKQYPQKVIGRGRLPTFDAARFFRDLFCVPREIHQDDYCNLCIPVEWQVCKFLASYAVNLSINYSEGLLCVNRWN
jgi:hypothetical protein